MPPPGQIYRNLSGLGTLVGFIRQEKLHTGVTQPLQLRKWLFFSFLSKRFSGFLVTLVRRRRRKKVCFFLFKKYFNAPLIKGSTH